MNKQEIKNGLQDLINRLKDAEKGYLEIERATSNNIVKKWLKKYAIERHQMQKTLKSEIVKLGGDPKANASLLGDLHRVFIGIKINAVKPRNEYDAIVEEVERGASILVEDFMTVLTKVAMPPELVTILMKQKSLIEEELSSLKMLKEELNSELAY